MKKDTITITRAEYAHLNKAANAAVEHACELFQAARLVDELQARIKGLEAERDEWFSKYQVLKERTDNYDFLLHKTREQEKEIYSLVTGLNVVEAENIELKASVAELKAKNDNIKNDYFTLHTYALELEERETHLENLLRHARAEERVAESRADLAETFLDRTLVAIGDALEGARIGGDYEGNMEVLSEVVQRYKI